jgi:nucleoside-diphosphate-sugar epimerase
MEPSQSNVAVTGAGGFIGHALRRQLFAGQIPTRALVRYRSDSPGEYQFELASHIMDPAAMASPPEVVVHCAWDNRTASIDEARQINLDGTQWLLSQCRKFGVKHLIFISSITASAESQNPYARAKWETQQALLGSTDGPTDITVIVAGLVIGGGGVLAKARQEVRRKKVIPLLREQRDRQIATVYIDDLCAAIATAIRDKITGRLLITDPQTVSVEDFYRGLGILEGRKPTIFTLPRRLQTALRRRPVDLNAHLSGVPPLDQTAIADSLQKVGGVPGKGYWQSLHRLATAENAADIAAELLKAGRF